MPKAKQGDLTTVDAIDKAQECFIEALEQLKVLRVGETLEWTEYVVKRDAAIRLLKFCEFEVAHFGATPRPADTRRLTSQPKSPPERG